MDQMTDISTVYIVTFDVDKYQSLLWDGEFPPRSVREFCGVRKGTDWQPAPVYSHQPRLERPDFWHLVGSATIVATPDVLLKVEPFFSEVGELLPLVVSRTNEEMFALNILRDIDCLDPDLSALDPIEMRFTFLEHRLPEDGLFKIPQLDVTDIFYLERTSTGDSLRYRIERDHLAGLTFEEVWSSTGGPADYVALRL